MHPELSVGIYQRCPVTRKARLRPMHCCWRPNGKCVAAADQKVEVGFLVLVRNEVAVVSTRKKLNL